MPSRVRRQHFQPSETQDLPPTTNDSMTSQHRLIIGVDFGTTYTSVAYVQTSIRHWSEVHSLQSFKDKAQVIRQWPNRAEDRNDIQTALLYNKKEPQDPYFGWGVEYAPDFCDKEDLSPEIRLFKLSMHSSPETTQIREQLDSIATGLDKTPANFVRDFLGKLRSYLLDGPESFFR